jgi:hypothetical protein
MRTLSWSLGALVLLACSPAEEKPEADVLGEHFETSESTSEGEVDMGPLADCVPPLPAVGVGDCGDVLGYHWAAECEPILGCSCEGEGCATLFADIADCGNTYAHCDPCSACTTEQPCVITCDHYGEISDIMCNDGCPDGFSSFPGCVPHDAPTELPYLGCSSTF